MEKKHKSPVPVKTDCPCEIVSVDGDKQKIAGWQCKCFKFTEPIDQTTPSFTGPGFGGTWVGGSNGTSGGGKTTMNVTNPLTGEVFVVEYKCNCP